MKISDILRQAKPTLPILQATFGLERESLRISNVTHRVAQTAHPSILGSRSYHPYIQTDYSEAQLELITPVAHSTKEARRLLGGITDVAQRSISQDEYLWPLSMPPQITEEETLIAQLENEFEYQYRVGLGQRYGKLLQSMSGIHYNMELGKDLVAQLFEAGQEIHFISFKNQLYLKLAQQFLTYRWFLIYLYGATPLAEKGFLKDSLTGPVRSIRNSSYGYVNHDDVRVSYATLEEYVQSIEYYVENGILSAEKEFYSAVRLRGSKRNRDYLEHGITYLEFRSFDPNPFDHLAISQETLDTVHLFILALLWLDDIDSTQVDQTIQIATEFNNLIALSHPLEKLPPEAPVAKIVTAMEAIVNHFTLGEYYHELVEQVKAALENPQLTLSGQLLSHINGLSLEEFGRKTGQDYHQAALQSPYALQGYENMELSTQLLLMEAIQKGIHFEILDENDQFLKLWHGNHVEYDKNGNMTSKDTYVVPLAIANKTVTKKILAEAGFPVPDGDEFSTPEDALAYYSLYG
ncbi:bifunctional glutamate--cysteine ligase GshA/glutathione synthetase GshB [Streptococcus sp. X16XC17]|nr:bifunctional glutamate--cysteine ligase GshA/glutathione synthetase GshB [Streptococcus sp. X16XC17]